MFSYLFKLLGFLLFAGFVIKKYFNIYFEKKLQDGDVIQ